MKQNDRLGLRTWIEIDTKKLKHNYKEFRKILPKKTKLCAVIKSNAYGHGIVDYAKVQEKNGVDFLAVDSIVEALTLRKNKIKKPILVLGYTLPENYIKAKKNNISITISSLEQLKRLCKTKNIKGIKVHFKIDTGMHRQGFMEYDASHLFDLLQKNKQNIEVEGVYSHFASASDITYQNESILQINKFISWGKEFEERGYEPIFHMSATGGALIYPEAHFDMVRVGLGLFGYVPNEDIRDFLSEYIELKPALKWKSIISEIKTVEFGEKIGYDFTAELGRDTQVAIVPVGYWHGFPRSLSNTGSVMINKEEASVLGRVSMDMLIVDITGIKTHVGDEVVILSGEHTFVEPSYVASQADTSVYELITRINPLIKKFYI